MGTCSHVASVLWFAGVMRLNSDNIEQGISNYYQYYCEDASEEQDLPDIMSDVEN